ncbi:hypothetical protein Dform_00851 [Dehalogenimonas formicexedens]|uniref:Uncharacterized protein n=1 Tax=Dehalogenimonas formicexedens TaxID=1839801 RepID=A0A1P8F6T4_9CHLR|nr:hypothetical protein Dform_00851 [Dehalogenimonas formicexedens]
MDKIGVPSVRTMKSAFGNYAVGALGGLIYSLGRSVFGNGLIGSLVAPVLAGSVVKGEAGVALATTAGFFQFSGIAGSSAVAASSAPAEQVI